MKPSFFFFALVFGCVRAPSSSAPAPLHHASPPLPSAWYAHPDPRIVAVRLARGETLFLGKYDVEIRHEVEHLNGLCMDRADGAAPSPSPELRTRAEVDESGAMMLVEETNRPGECTRTPKERVTRTKLTRIEDRAKLDELEAKARPFFDATSCRRYDACCADRTREDWDVHCERRRNFAAGCWSHWLMMNDDRACPPD